MESTGVYWIPLFGVLEERGFQVMLVDYIKTGEEARGRLRSATEEDLRDGAVIRVSPEARRSDSRHQCPLPATPGFNRGNTYEALSEDGNPTLATLLKVANALGLRLSLVPVEDRALGAQPTGAGVFQQESACQPNRISRR